MTGSISSLALPFDDRSGSILSVVVAQRTMRAAEDDQEGLNRLLIEIVASDSVGRTCSSDNGPARRPAA
jgi:hypothetical protein